MTLKVSIYEKHGIKEFCFQQFEFSTYDYAVLITMCTYTVAMTMDEILIRCFTKGEQLSQAASSFILKHPYVIYSYVIYLLYLEIKP